MAVDLLNCTSVQSAATPTHPSARDDVGTIAAMRQSNEPDGQPLMDVLVPFHMLYADGVERLAAESVHERSKWVHRIWYVSYDCISIALALMHSTVNCFPPLRRRLGLSRQLVPCERSFPSTPLLAHPASALDPLSLSRLSVVSRTSLMISIRGPPSPELLRSFRLTIRELSMIPRF